MRQISATQSVIQVDAFSNNPFTGNPAAVCVMEEGANDDWMRKVAAEMNLSETAFVVRCGDDFGLRWFTPVMEVDLCGHATLASAHVLWSEEYVTQKDSIRFHTKSGLLTATLKGNWIELNFPSQPVQPIEPLPLLLEALGLAKIDDGVEVFANAVNYLVEVSSPDILRGLQPDFAHLATLPKMGSIVTCPGEGDYDFLSRYFAPNAGIDEDPVTGSAHCSLAPYWSNRLGQSELLAYQASARGGIVKVVMLGDRVAVSGQAVTVMRGQLSVAPPKPGDEAVC